MILFRIRNLGVSSSSPQTVDKIDPFIFIHPGYPAIITGPGWAETRSLDHAFLSAVCGVIPSQRVSNSNPPALIHGLIGDFDECRGLNEESFSRAIAAISAQEFPPQAAALTKRGGVRLFWEFDRPLPVPPAAHIRGFYREIFRRLSVAKFGLGEIDGASENPSQYHEIGTNWVKVSEKRIEQSIAEFILSQALAKHNPGATAETKVPLDEVTTMLREAFPGQIAEPLRVGQRFARFWDPGADNESAAVVCDGGFFCFTGPKPFVSWRELIGEHFATDRAARARRAILDKFFYGQSGAYFSRCPRSHAWLRLTKPVVERQLRALFKLNIKGDSSTMSQLDIAFHSIESENYVCGVQTRPFLPPGDLSKPVLLDGRPWLVERSIRLLDLPAIPRPSPRIDEFLSVFFGPHADWARGWIARGLRAIYWDKILMGQALWLVSPPRFGKTFFVDAVLGKAFGKAAPAQGYFEGENFEDDLADSALWTVHDPTWTGKDRRMLTDKIRQVTSVPTLSVNRKFTPQFSMPWYGRVIFTCNPQGIERGAYIYSDESVEDKVAAFVAAGDTRTLVDTDAKREAMLAEVPDWAAFLVRDHALPSHLETDSRYAVGHFVDPWIKTVAERTDGGRATVTALRFFARGLSLPKIGRVFEIDDLRILLASSDVPGAREVSAASGWPQRVARTRGKVDWMLVAPDIGTVTLFAPPDDANVPAVMEAKA